MERIEPKKLGGQGEVLQPRESGRGLETNRNVGKGSVVLGPLWEESCKSFVFGMGMEGWASRKIG
jgi:hypothetical protein